jgi:pyruvate kinase
LVRLQTLEVNKKDGYADFIITAGGEISSKKGVNIPEGELSTKNPTEKDIRDLTLIAKLNPEYVAASFVGNAREVKEIRSILSNGGAFNVKIISKIERPIGLKNFDEILKESDGIMVARGDLGVEIPAEDVPRWQKTMIKKCNQAGKPVIVATQMLESMIQNPVPTRAEVNDIYNAVNDRTDAVMLSGETSVGKYWQEAVTYMSTIAAKAEKFIPEQDPDNFDSEDQEIVETAGHAVYTITKELMEIGYRAKCVVITRSGKTAQLIAKYRPKYPILAISNDIQVVRQLKLVWGVFPVYMTLNMDNELESIIKEGIKQLVEYGLLGRSEYAIVLMPSRLVQSRNPIIGLYYPNDILADTEIVEKEYSIDNIKEKL